MSLSFLKTPKNEKELLMGDAIRVLSLLLGKLWLTELSAEVESFRMSLERPLPFTDSDLKEAIDALDAMNVVVTQDALRATYDRPEPDVLVGLVDYWSLQDLLESDNDVKRYKMLSRF
ncbi:MAG: hypothetical protein ACUVQ8_04765 [Nitrososphaeria archaeon]